MTLYSSLNSICTMRGRIGLGFDVPGQPTPTIRLALTVEHAKALQQDLASFIAAQEAAEFVAGKRA